jgi:hypothetical protein
VPAMHDASRHPEMGLMVGASDALMSVAGGSRHNGAPEPFRVWLGF